MAEIRVPRQLPTPISVASARRLPPIPASSTDDGGDGAERGREPGRSAMMMITLNGGFDEGSTMTNGFDGHRDDDETPPRMRTTSSSSTKGVDHPHHYRREGCCASGGRGTNCRSNESIVPLSPSGAASGTAVTTTSTNNNTTATTDFKRLPIAVSQQKQKRRWLYIL